MRFIKKPILESSMVNYLSIFIRTCMSLKGIFYLTKYINFAFKFYFPNLARAFPEVGEVPKSKMVWFQRGVKNNGHTCISLLRAFLKKIWNMIPYIAKGLENLLEIIWNCIFIYCIIFKYEYTQGWSRSDHDE